MNRKAVIFGLSGYKLTAKEKKILKKEKPWGIILFSRNINDLYQLKTLIKNIKTIVKDKKYPILIDQEGGKVSRLNKIVDFSVFSQEFFGKLYNKDKTLFFYYYKIYITKVCDLFNKVGININTAPVLDIKRKKSHNIIGTRSFSEKTSQVSKLGKFCINFYNKNKIATVIKHIPGHGLAKSDSHKKTPIVKAKRSELIKKDFKPFKLCKSPFAMTAHVIYKNFDPIYAATQSNKIIKDVIRKHINFNGILISDDISMKALKYGLENNAKKALSAGCNLILHCNGKINEMLKLVKVIPKIDKYTQKKTSDFYKFLE